MNIKSLMGTIQNVASMSKATRTSSQSSSTQSSSADRDADGRQTRDESTKDERPLSHEETEELLKVVADWPGIKDKLLTFSLVDQEGIKVLLIKDPLGNTVKRIPSKEFRSLLANKVQSTGRLLNKAM